MFDKSVPRRVGRFQISGYLLRTADRYTLQLIQIAMAKVLIIGVQYDAIRDMFEYQALSLEPIFDIIEDGEIIPEYTLVVTSNPNQPVTSHFKPVRARTLQ